MVTIIQDKEVIMLILGIGVLLFTIFFREIIRRIYAWKYLMTGFYILFASWIFTIAESFLWPSLLNWLEHIGYMISAVFIAIWCIKFANIPAKVTH